jgi:regulator of sigma E protease
MSEILNFVLNVSIIILIIGILVFVHELGHYLAARATGMLVEEFAIGFGPVLWSFKKGETNYMIKLLPLGGYVKILGEAGEEDDWLESKDVKEKLTKDEINELEESKNNPRSFSNKPKRARFLVMIAGVTMNYALAVICSYIWLAGNNYAVQLPADMIDLNTVFAEKVLEKQGPLLYTKLSEEGVAIKAGLPTEGEIKSIDGQSVELSSNFREVIKQKIGKEVSINICKETLCSDYKVTVPETGVIGIYLPVNYSLSLQYNGTTRIFAGFASTVDNLKLMGYVLSSLFTTAKETGNYQDVAVNSFSSPIALYFVVDAFKAYGVAAILRLVGEFSFSLALINVLPIPALDGGRIFLLAIEALRGKPLNRKIENTIIAVSFYALMLLMLVVVLKDIWFINVIRDMFN